MLLKTELNQEEVLKNVHKKSIVLDLFIESTHISTR